MNGETFVNHSSNVISQVRSPDALSMIAHRLLTASTCSFGPVPSWASEGTTPRTSMAPRPSYSAATSMASPRTAVWARFDPSVADFEPGSGCPRGISSAEPSRVRTSLSPESPSQNVSVSTGSPSYTRRNGPSATSVAATVDALSSGTTATPAPAYFRNRRRLEPSVPPSVLVLRSSAPASWWDIDMI